MNERLPFRRRAVQGRAWLLWALLGMLSASGLSSRDAEAAHPKGKQSELELLQTISSEGKAIEMLRAASQRDPAKAMRLVQLILSEGSTQAVLLAAIELAHQRGGPGMSAQLAPYAGHRKLAISVASTKALSRTGGPAAVAALRRALRSREPEVRTAAADGLRYLHPREAWDDLVAAFRRGNLSAAGAIGRICRGSECRSFAREVTKVPLTYMQLSLDGMLFRDSEEVSDEDKIFIARLIWSGITTELQLYLSEVAARLPAGTSPKVKNALLAGAWMKATP